MPFLSFANPTGLWLLPLAGLPLLIHLLRRRRAQVIPFPDIRYLQQARTASVRISRVRQILLLTIRTLAMLCLTLIPARPQTKLSLTPWLGGAVSRLVIILDDSASMAASEGRGTLFEHAKQRVVNLLKQLGPQSQIAVISASRGSGIITGFTGPARAAAVIQNAPQTALATDIPAALHSAGKLLDVSGPFAGRILLLSDLQKTAFPDGFSPPDIAGLQSQLTVIPVQASRPLGNLAWTRMEVKPLIGKVLVEATVIGGIKPKLELAVGKKTIYRANPVADTSGLASISFGLPYGDSVRLISGGDDLPMDDNYYIAAKGGAEKKVLLAAGSGSPEAGFIERAMKSLSRTGYKTEIYRSGKAPKNASYDLVMVYSPSIDGHLQNAIMQNTYKYKALLIIPPFEADFKSYNEKLLNGLGAPRLLGLADSSGGYRILKEQGAGDPLPDVRQSALDPVKTLRYWRASQTNGLVLSINGNDPALVVSDARAKPWAMLLTGCCGPMSDLALRPVFLVLLLQVMEALTGGGALHVHPGDGTTSVPPRFFSGSQNTEEGDLPDQPGWYDYKGRRLAVNIDPAESDLTPAGEKDLDSFFGKAGWRLASADEAILPGGPYPLERLLLILCAILLAAEMVVRRA
jgi:hypothetical protein